MTLPYERSRAVVQTRDFLMEISQDTSLPEPIRNEAHRLLRHYPSKNNVLLAGKIEEKYAENSFIEPIFSSSIER
ncbi:hypothetical protein IIE18_12045 [Pseudomonas sp. V1]|uniref:BPSL0761 family protein n=1 Tax=Pseudomonas arcuscaelestis TaxID=2710591 RepID=UPI00193FDABC|nr:BPSL0761 family protein [Pseudomonas arcuscaelestis]MBM3105871.1 hypothetical protein [Pseudomonas arcuscaelestis]